MGRLRVYLAGPDVFRPAPVARGAALKAICAAAGLDAVYPLDPLADEPPEWALLPPARAIALRNEAHIRGCEALIANLTPFRGPSADPGTVFELGYARALGLRVYGWTTDPRPFAERTVGLLGTGATRDAEGGWRDADGLSVEAFGCVDNLMLDGAILASGGALVVSDGDEMTAFRRCVELIANRAKKSFISE